MVKNRKLFNIAVAVTMVVCFQMGYVFAQATSATIQDILFSKGESTTRVTVLADAVPEMKVALDKEKHEITLSFDQTIADNIFQKLQYADDLVESVLIVIDKKKETMALTLKFKSENVSFFRSEPDSGKGLAIDFKAKKNSIRIAGISEERFLEKFKRKPKEPDTPDEPDDELAATATAPVERPEDVEGALARAMGESDGDAKDRLKSDITPEEVEKRFVETDKIYTMLEKQAGHEAYVNMLKKLQKGEFAESIKLAEDFINDFPNSIYQEKAHYLLADAHFNMAKSNISLVKNAMDSYSGAIAKYPDSKMAYQGIIRKADLLLSQEFYIEALAEYGVLLRQAPKNKYAINAMIGRADIFIRQKKYQRGYNELERILVLFPGRREVRDAKYLIGQSFHDRGKYKEARLIFNDALKIWPTFPKSRPSLFLKIADTSFKTGHIQEAMDHWFTISNLFPRSRSGRKALLKIADRYVATNRKREAAQFYETLSSRFSDNNEGLKARMRLASLGAEDPELLKRSQIFDYTAFENPLKTFDEVLKKKPKKLGQEALERKGIALSAMKQYVGAIVAFKELLKSYPEARMSDRIFNLIRLNFLKLIDTYHEQDGFFMTLMTFYENFDPFLRTVTQPGTLLKIADSYSEMTLYGRAIEYYKKAAAYDKDKVYQADIIFSHARTALLAGDTVQAEFMITKYIQGYSTRKNINQARFILGSALMDQGKKAHAATEWRLGIEMDQVDPMVGGYAFKLANLYKGDSKHLLAIDAYNEAIASYYSQMKTAGDKAPIEEKIRESYYQIAESHYLMKNYPKAIRWADKFASLFPEAPENKWMSYIASSSLSAIDKQEQAIARFRKLSGDNTAIGKVAASRLVSQEWRNKNPELFLD